MLIWTRWISPVNSAWAISGIWRLRLSSLRCIRRCRRRATTPINQIVGYILSEDPTYITNHNNARTLIRKIDRDELLQVLVRKYLGQ